jgi:hypothetical protein
MGTARAGQNTRRAPALFCTVSARAPADCFHSAPDSTHCVCHSSPHSVAVNSPLCIHVCLLWSGFRVSDVEFRHVCLCVSRLRSNCVSRLRSNRAAQWKLRNETAEEEGRVSRAPRTRGIWRLELRDWCCVCGLEIGVVLQVVCARLLLRLVAACCCSCLRVVCVGVSSLAFAGLAA